MISEFRKIMTLIVFSLMFMGESFAQPKSIGTTYSLSGISLSYEHYTDNESFIDTSIKAECGDMFFGVSRFPGITASFTWNMIFSRIESRNGNEIRFLAGPGLVLGWSNDLLKKAGTVFGLRGRVGAECVFDRNVTISASLCPTIGTHMIIHDDYLDLRYYRMGILSLFLPEIGIRYSF